MGIRCFIAVPLSEEILTAVSRLQEILADQIQGVKWVAPAAMHLTVRFIGDISERQSDQLCDRVAEAASRVRPFTLQAVGAGAFPTASRARVLWAGIKPHDHPLWQELVTTVEDQVLSCGLPPADKLSQPHLTVGRVRRPVRNIQLSDVLSQLAGHEWGIISVGEIRVYKSRLTPRGPIHDVLAACQLGC